MTLTVKNGTGIYHQRIGDHGTQQVAITLYVDLISVNIAFNMTMNDHAGRLNISKNMTVFSHGNFMV